MGVPPSGLILLFQMPSQRSRAGLTQMPPSGLILLFKRFPALTRSGVPSKPGFGLLGWAGLTQMPPFGLAQAEPYGLGDCASGQYMRGRGKYFRSRKTLRLLAHTWGAVAFRFHPRVD